MLPQVNVPAFADIQMSAAMLKKSKLQKLETTPTAPKKPALD